MFYLFNEINVMKNTGMFFSIKTYKSQICEIGDYSSCSNTVVSLRRTL